MRDAKALLILAPLVLLGVACATTKSSSTGLDYPDLPNVKVAPQAPRLQTQPLAEVLDLDLKVRQGLARSLPLPKNATLGLVVEAPRNVFTRNGLPIADRTLELFLKRKIAVTDLNGMAAIHVEVSTSKKTNVGSKETTLLRGAMPQMMVMADVLRPDYALTVRFDAVRTVDQNLVLNYVLDQASRQTYQKNYQRFIDAAQSTRSELLQIKSSQDKAFEKEIKQQRRAQKRYKAWNDFWSKIQPAFVLGGAGIRRAQQKHDGFVKDLRRRVRQIDHSIQTIKTPAQWESDILANPKEQTIKIGYADAWVTLVDTKRGTTLWKARLVKKDQTAEDAYVGVIEGLLGRLYREKTRRPKRRSAAKHKRFGTQGGN